MRVDGDNPLLAIGGDVVAHANDGTLGYNPTLTVDAKDDSTSSANGAYDQSGVSQVIVSLDDPNNHIYVWWSPGGCGDNCPAHFTITLPVTTPGPHKLWVVALDRTGHRGSLPITAPYNSDGSLSFNVATSPEDVAAYSSLTFDVPEDTTDNASNADQLPVATSAVVAAASAAPPASRTATSWTSSSWHGVQAGSATASSGAASDGCAYDHSRDGFVIQLPQRIYDDNNKTTDMAVLQVFKQNRADSKLNGSTMVTTKQFVLCAWGGTQTHNGYRLKRTAVAFWLRTSIPRMLNAPVWSTGVTGGRTSTTMTFGLSDGPVSVSVGASSTGDGELKGTIGMTDEINRYAAHTHDDVTPFAANMVTAYWKGDSPDYQGTTGQAMYEMPQSARNPNAQMLPITSFHCGKIWPFPCG
jgi:hypothetical protein